MISTSVVDGSKVVRGERELKVEQFGAKTADECASFGDDANPLRGMTAIFAETTEEGEPFIIGYVNQRQIAQPGEKRIYSLKPNGDLSIDIILKGDGTIELGGKTNNLVRYAPLNAGLQSLVARINQELIKIQVGLVGIGGVYTPNLTTLDITQSKINEIKTL